MNTHRKVAVALAMILLLVPLAHAAERVVTVYPTAMLSGLIAGEYEWATSSDTSRVIRLGAASVTTPDGKSSAISGALGLHKYMDGRAIDGLYIGGSVTVVGANVVDTVKSESFSAFILGVAGRAGYKLMVADSIVLDVAVNASLPIYASAAIGSQNVTGLGAGPFGLGLSVGVGYTW